MSKAAEALARQVLKATRPELDQTYAGALLAEIASLIDSHPDVRGLVEALRSLGNFDSLEGCWCKDGDAPVPHEKDCQEAQAALSNWLPSKEQSDVPLPKP